MYLQSKLIRGTHPYSPEARIFVCGTDVNDDEACGVSRWWSLWALATRVEFVCALAPFYLPRMRHWTSLGTPSCRFPASRPQAAGNSYISCFCAEPPYHLQRRNHPPSAAVPAAPRAPWPGCAQSRGGDRFGSGDGMG